MALEARAKLCTCTERLCPSLAPLRDGLRKGKCLKTQGLPCFRGNRGRWAKPITLRKFFASAVEYGSTVRGRKMEEHSEKSKGRYKQMSIGTQAVLAGQVDAAAKAAGLIVVSSEVGKDFSGNPTTRFALALSGDTTKTQVVELSDRFDFSRTDLLADVAVYLAEAAKRLKNPRPDCYLTLHGLPLSFGGFAWPFHASSSGADTFLVHGEVRL